MFVEGDPRELDWAYKELIRQRDNERYNIVKRLIEKGVDIGNAIIEKDKDKDTYLIAASYQGFTNTVRLILSVPGVNFDAENNKGQNAFDLADNEEIKRLLLDARRGIFPSVLRQGIQRK